MDKIFRGEDFFGFLLGGIDFLTSKGGISFKLINNNFKNFPNFSGQGGTLWIFRSNFSKRGGGNILPKSRLPEGEEQRSKIFLGGYPLDSFTLARIWTKYQ